MNTIRKQWLKDFGYSPSDNEILDAYYCGTITLSDKEENSLLEYFNL